MTKTELMNLALSKIGDRTVNAAVDAGSKEGRLVGLHYGPVLREALRAFFWPFALATRTLAEIDRRAMHENGQFRLTAVEPGLAGNGISMTVAGGVISHGLVTSGKAIVFRMGTLFRLTVGGTTDPVSAGTLYHVAVPHANTFPGKHAWSTDAAAEPPLTGTHLRLHQGWLVTSVEATLNELAPKGNYTATNNPGTATRVSVYDATFTTVKVYVLLAAPGFPARWTLSGDSTASSRDHEIVPAGSHVYPSNSPGPGFIGGVLGPLQDSAAAQWVYFLTKHVDNVATGNWRGAGSSPDVATWIPLGSATGVPTVRATGLAATLDEMAAIYEGNADAMELAELDLLAPGPEFAVPLDTSLLSGGVADDEVTGWSRAFVLPEDFVKIKELRTAGADGGRGRKIDRYALRRVGGKSCLLCDAEAVSLEYVQEVDDPGAYDPLFVAAFTTLLAARLARAITGSDEMESRFVQAYEAMVLPNARTASAQDSESNENHPLREFLDGNLTKTRGDFFPRF